jgi:hypothetical protein
MANHIDCMAGCQNRLLQNMVARCARSLSVGGTGPTTVRFVSRSPGSADGREGSRNPDRV